MTKSNSNSNQTDNLATITLLLQVAAAESHKARLFFFEKYWLACSLYFNLEVFALRFRWSAKSFGIIVWRRCFRYLKETLTDKGYCSVTHLFFLFSHIPDHIQNGTTSACLMCKIIYIFLTAYAALHFWCALLGSKSHFCFTFSSSENVWRQSLCIRRINTVTVLSLMNSIPRLYKLLKKENANNLILKLKVFLSVT